MRHERIPIEQKLRGDKCEPCEPAYGVGLNESHAPERVSMNAASTSVSALRNGSGNEMEWLMGEGMDDPLSSLLHMEQEAQGGTGDFGTLGDDLFGMPAPSGIFADNAGGSRGGVPVKRDDPPPVSGSRTTADETARQRVRETRTEAFSENGGVESSAPGADASATTVDGPVSEKKNNGASGVALMWSQTKEEVTLSVVVPPGTRASDVAVRCTSDRVEVAVTAKREGKTDENTAAAAAAAACFLSDAWTHPIDPEPNDDDDDVFGNVFGDWEVCDWDPDGSRVVRVTARKKTIGNSLVHWWNRGVKSGVPIDVAAIAARRDNKKNVARAEEARRVWDEATEAFKKKVKDREKITIHV